MVTLLNSANPYLRIYIEKLETFVQFQGGRLEIERDDPSFEKVMEVAATSPTIRILVNELTCPECGEVFEGQTGKARLSQHRKKVHFESWLQDQDVAAAKARSEEIKSNAGLFCDVCQPLQTFPDKDALAHHTQLIHLQPPTLDDEGNTIGGGEGIAGPPPPGRAASRPSRAGDGDTG